MKDRFIALIRGINVGRAKRIAMADLRALFGELGYSDVSTLLNSGNVIFNDTSSAPSEAATRIEKAIDSRLGVSARVTVLTASDLNAIVRENPLLQVIDNPSRLIIAVPLYPADRARFTPLTQQEWAPEILALGTRATYLWCPDGILSSRLAKAIGRAASDFVTTRNWRTILKIHALIND